MPPRRTPRPSREVTELLERRDQLESSFFDRMEENRERYALAEEIEQDNEITERTRDRRLASINAKIEATEDEMGDYKDEIDRINATLAAMGLRVEPFENVIDRQC